MSAESIPESLKAALDRYEQALSSNDAETLSEFFLEDSKDVPVWRADGAGLLVGHDEIARFRRHRRTPPRRALVREIIRMTGEDSAVCIRSFERGAGGQVLQSQAWVRSTLPGEDGGAGEGPRRRDDWRIVAAHLSYPDAAVDGRIWRVVGTPLVRGAQRGPLSGMRLGVKDLYAVAGFAIGAGNEDFLHEGGPEANHAWAVQQLLDAGCDVTGITRTDEFAFSLTGTDSPYGVVPNIWCPGRVSGGSSSGSASATAAGQVEVGLGTDTGGSIRVPSAYQGLWGIRTTHGVVPREGLLPLAQSFDTVGWMSRDSGTLGQVARVLVPEGKRHAMSNASEAFIWCDDLFSNVESSVRDACEAVLKRLGDRVVRFPRFSDFLGVSPSAASTMLEHWLSVFQTIQGVEAWRNHGAWLSAHIDSVGAAVASRFLYASRYTEKDYEIACAERNHLRAAFIRNQGHRMIMVPSASSPAPVIEDSRIDRDAFAGVRGDTMKLTSIGGITGLPVVNMPLKTAQGFPCGLSFIGPEGTDCDLIKCIGDLAHA